MHIMNNIIYSIKQNKAIKHSKLNYNPWIDSDDLVREQDGDIVGVDVAAEGLAREQRVRAALGAQHDPCLNHHYHYTYYYYIIYNNGIYYISFSHHMYY